MMKQGKQRRKSTLNMVAAMVMAVAMVISATPLKSKAAVQSPVAAAKVSFTFDDGLTSAVTKAAPTLQKHGLTGTDYVITGCVGMSKAPNTCHANTDASYMTWTQIKKLQATYGWEIGSHTATHPYLATKDATDGQPNVLTHSQVTAELKNSKAALAAQGINATDFSTPYGDYNNFTLSEVAKYYASHRGFADDGNNTWPNNDYLLYDMRVQSGVSVAQVKARIDQAIANKQWLILTLHDIKDKASKNPDDYEYSTANLDAIAAYVQTKQASGQLQAVNVDHGLVASDQNMLPNASFDNGLASGWTTDDASSFRADNGNNGSYPSPTNSVKFTSVTGESHLFSPRVNVNASTTYMIKNFLNVQSLTSGEVAFYVDEYDVNGNWVSGQYKKAENSSFVENLNFPYTPTSASVTTASLQVIVSGSGISGYLDNVQWFALKTVAQTQTNLMPGGSFETGLGSWTTDSPTTIKADASGMGSGTDAAHSVKMVASPATAHLFAPGVKVSSSQNYTVTNYLNLKAITSGEVAFYVDEYDVNGNWVSGQYKLGVHTMGARDVSFAYTPTSVNVSKANLQVIVVGNSGITAYFDNARWYANLN